MKGKKKNPTSLCLTSLAGSFSFLVDSPYTGRLRAVRSGFFTRCHFRRRRCWIVRILSASGVAVALYAGNCE